MATPHSPDTRREQFADQAVRLRWRVGLTRRELAGLLGLSEDTVRRWEVGRALPGATSLRALLVLYLQRGAFAPGEAEEGAGALWEAACRESPRRCPPLDRAWLRALHGAPPPAAGPPRGQDWGDAPEAGAFYGRSAQLATLAAWMRDEQARLIAVLGSGGVGKTALATRLARDQAPSVEYLYWRSLRNALPVEEWLAGAIGVLSDRQLVPPAGTPARLVLLRELLRERAALLVLDNFETVLEPGVALPRYRAGYEGYGEVLQLLGERGHRATLLLTSRETPPEIAPLSGPRHTWQILRLSGLGVAESRALLQPLGLGGRAADWHALVAHCGGNALALRLVGETIADQFAGQVAAFLAAGAALPADVVRLLEGQVNRLSPLERAVLLQLAVAREPVSFAEVARSLTSAGRGAVLGAAEGLRRRSLLERGEQGATITLQPVVLEYMTDHLVQAVGEEMTRGQPALLVSQALVQATAPEHVRRCQERLIAEPLLEQLRASLGSVAAVERRLLALLDGWRGRPVVEQGYGPGTVVNLLRLLRGDLCSLDLSRLAIQQAYLQETEMQQSSLAGAQVSRCVLAEAFDYSLCVALSADGAYVAAGTTGGEVRLWHVADRTPLLTAQAHAGATFGVALSADGQTLLSGGADGTVQLWATRSRERLATLQSHCGAVYGVALSADGRLLAGGGSDGTVGVWHAESREHLHTLRGHEGSILNISVSPDGRRLASSGVDGTTRLWATDSGACLAILRGHPGGVWDVALSADGGLLVSSGADGTIKQWAGASGACLATLHGPPGGLRRVALSRDGRLLAGAGVDGTVQVWALETGTCLAALQGHSGVVPDVALSADGRVLASSGGDGTIKLWAVASGACRATFHGHSGGVYGVALSADGHLLAIGSADGTVKVLAAGTGKRLVMLRNQSGGVWRVALSADGRIVAGGGGDGTITLWTVDGGQQLTTLDAHHGGVWGLALNDDGQLAASGGMEGTITLWATSRGDRLATVQGHSGGVRGVALSADGTRLAGGGEDGTVRLWAVDGGQCVCLTTVAGQGGGVWDVAFSADGRLLAASSVEGTITLWATETGACQAILHERASAVYGVALSGDGRQLASGAADGTIRLWDVPRGTCDHIVRPDRLYERLDITGLSGVTEAQRSALLALGAVEHSL